MPTLECLDERTQRVLDKLDEMYELFTANHRQLKEMYQRREQAVDERLAELDKEIQQIKLTLAKEDGKKSVTLWVGGLVIAMAGAMANTAVTWFLGPHGPINK